MLNDVPSKIVRNPGRYAVMLNANAKRWTGELHQSVLRWVPSKDLFLTDDFRQAERTVDRLLAEDYQTIFTGGGDGTIVYLMNAIARRVRDGEIDADEAPPVGVLRMGTGNAIATWLRCGKIVDDLRLLRAGAPLVVYDVNMVVGEDGEAFPFAGFGWDANILNDYDDFKVTVRETAVENFATGLGGYAASILGKTIPRAVLDGGRPVRVTALAHTLETDAEGNVRAEHSAGDLLFEGGIKIISGASIPYWGFGVRMFPLATAEPGYFHLRAFEGSIRSVLGHLPKFWRGELVEGTRDYITKGARVEILDGPMAYHVAGDPKGNEESVDWYAAASPYRLAVPMR